MQMLIDQFSQEFEPQNLRDNFPECPCLDPKRLGATFKNAFWPTSKYLKLFS